VTEPADVLRHLAEQERARILSMEAGAELNALVAEKIFSLTPCDGWVPMNFGSAGGPALARRCDHAPDTCYSTRTLGSIRGRIGGAPPYSTDPGAAWLVVEALPGCCTKIIRENVAGVRYDVTINLDESHTRTFHAMAGTMPLAVCRCALLAARP
jgi:hypothetical protein